jgi:hypothetical protein
MINSAPSFFRWLPQQCKLPAELIITGTTGNLVSNHVPPRSQSVVGIVAVAVVTGTCDGRCAYLRFIQRYLTLSLTWPQIRRLGFNFGYLQAPQINCRKNKDLSYLGRVSSHLSCAESHGFRIMLSNHGPSCHTDCKQRRMRNEMGGI